MNIYLFIYTILLFSYNLLYSYDKKINQNIYRKKASIILQDFFNINNNPSKTYSEYIDDLIQIIKNIDSSDAKKFVKSLRNLKDAKNHLIVAMVFWKNRQFFDKDVIEKLKSYDRKMLIDAFYIRNKIKL
jgi:hypothetical protein